MHCLPDLCSRERATYAPRSFTALAPCWLSNQSTQPICCCHRWRSLQSSWSVCWRHRAKLQQMWGSPLHCKAAPCQPDRFWLRCTWRDLWHTLWRSWQLCELGEQLWLHTLQSRLENMQDVLLRLL